MPTYAHQCSACSHEFDDWCSIAERNRPVDCPKCHADAPRVWRTNGVAKTGIFPYTTTHLDGKGTPITIESLSHLRSLERQHGVKATAFSDHRSHWDDAGAARGGLPTSRTPQWMR